MRLGVRSLTLAQADKYGVKTRALQSVFPRLSEIKAASLEEEKGVGIEGKSWERLREQRKQERGLTGGEASW